MRTERRRCLPMAANPHRTHQPLGKAQPEALAKSQEASGAASCPREARAAARTAADREQAERRRGGREMAALPRAGYGAAEQQQASSIERHPQENL